MGDWTPREEMWRELRLRLASAAVLIPAALWVVWAGGWWLAAGCAVFAYAMTWEWGRMSAHPRTHVLAALVAAGCFSHVLGQPWLTALLFAAAIAFGFVTEPGPWTSRVTSVFGIAYVGAMVTGLWLLREGPWEGRLAALYFMSFVWASDAAAFFTGRAIGGPRLLPSESPNKTWSGAIGALIACAVCGYSASRIELVPALPWIATGILISILAQSGDLLESGLKRRFKVKDSSRLLPGHGGVLDRVDGLGAVAAVMSLCLMFFPAWPRALGL